MADNMEVIISAVDEASSIFQAIANSCSEMMSAIAGSADGASESIDELAPSAEAVESAIEEIDPSSIDDVGTSADESSTSADNLSNSLDNVDGSSLSDVASDADGLSGSLDGASDAADKLGGSLGAIEGSMLLSAADQIGKLASGAEDMAQQMNEASITVGQLATNVNMAEPQMVSLINEISNATFPREEAMAYVGALNQMGVSADKLGDSATNMDRINDATGMGYTNVMQLTQGLRSMGIEADNLPSSFNAIAYAQANVNGGASTLSTVLKRQAATINEYGLSVDQIVLIMQKLSEQGVQGMKMGSELSNVLKENNGDIQAIEESLGMQSGALQNATDATGQYEGQLQKLADEEAAHKTILDQMGAAWEDVSLSLSGILAPASSFLSVIGSLGSFGTTIKGLKELSTTFTQLKESKYGVAAANYVQAASETIVSAATAIYGTAVAVLTGEIGLAEAATMAWNAVLAMNPMVWVAAAAIGLAVAIYEVGKAFGWWTDVSSMLDAVWAGVQRLWSTFINHPDVQAIIGALTGAWDSLVSVMGMAWNALMDFFGVSTGGDFDVVRALIEGIGFAWEVVTMPIRTLISLIEWFVSGIQAVASGQINLVTTVLNYWNILSSSLGAILMYIINSIITWAANILTYGITGAANFVNGVINNIKSLPGRFLNYLVKTGTNIVNQGSKWVSNAKNKASALVTGAINHFKTLPGKTLTQMGKVATSIESSGAQWVSGAKAKAGEVVSGVYNTLSKTASRVSSALSAVKEAIVKPFRDAYNAAKDWWNKTTNLQGSGAAGFDYEGMLEELQRTGSVDLANAGYTVEESTVSIENDVTLTLDLKNVPDNMSEANLLAWLREAVNDKTIINELVSNPDFQDLDNKVKQRIKLKNKRARGA